MKNDYRITKMKFSLVYPLYVEKAERKNRTREEVDQVISWLTGYSKTGIQQQIKKESDFETFFADAPAIHGNSSLIRGVVCSVRVEEIEEACSRRSRAMRQNGARYPSPVALLANASVFAGNKHA